MTRLNGFKVLGLIAAAASAAAAAALIPTSVTAAPGYQPIATSTPPVPSTPPVSLPPNEQGYVRVNTASQAIGCSVIAALVACETSSNGWPPRSDGKPSHTVSVNADGELQFVDADLGALEGRVALSRRTYWAQGWTVTATTDAITFTNDRTGHGMRVSEQKVQAF